MIKNCLLLFLSFYIFQCNAQPDFYYLNDSYFKGNPKIVTASTFNVQTDSITGSETLTQENSIQVDIYTKSRQCISHQWQNLETEITREFRFNYDNNGNRVEFLIFDKDSILNQRYVTLFDSTQNEISHEVYDAKNELLSQTIEMRTLDNLTVTTLTKDETGVVLKKSISIRDSLGREIKNLRFNKDVDVQFEYFYKYNENNQIVEYVRIEPSIDTITIHYRYDSLGREVESNQYKRANNQCIYSYIRIFRDSLNQQEYLEYDNGKLIKSGYRSLDSNDCITQIVEYQITYPSVFNRLKKTEYFETETRFLYDQSLNWITKTIYVNGKKTTLQERKFDYY